MLWGDSRLVDRHEEAVSRPRNSQAPIRHVSILATALHYITIFTISTVSIIATALQYITIFTISIVSIIATALYHYITISTISTVSIIATALHYITIFTISTVSIIATALSFTSLHWIQLHCAVLHLYDSPRLQ